jgi:L-threonylcarbamoyladenylate synthase
MRCNSLIKNIRKIDPKNPEPEIIQEAVDALKKGCVIAFPTTCLYGLGADAFNNDAVEAVFKIKKRSLTSPLLVLVSDSLELKDLVKEVPAMAEKLINKFWPGRVTLVFEALNQISEKLTAKTGKIGVRMPGHPVALAIARNMGRPITGTSANISGHKGCSIIEDIDLSVAEKLALILDAGTLEGGIGSTVVDVTDKKPLIIREGRISKKDIFDALA